MRVKSVTVWMTVLTLALGPAVPPASAAQASSIVVRPTEENLCIIANEFPEIRSLVEPPGGATRARLYFRSDLGPEFYYVEMTQQQPGVWMGILPRPTIEAGAISMYIQGIDLTLTDARSVDFIGVVVESEEDCEDRPIAPISPVGPAQVFTVGGLPAAGLAGFGVGGIAGAAAGGVALTTILLAAGGAAAVAGAVVVSGGSSPSPSPTPVVTPTPTPIPPTPPPPPPSPSPTPVEPPPPPVSPVI